MDTVVFRLHNVKDKYPIIWQLCLQQREGKQLLATRAELPEEKVDTVMKFFLNYKAGSAVPIRYSDKRNIPSSNHDIPFFIDQTKEFLEVNVSIPKYLFGNNVLEVITPPGHKLYTANQLSPYAHVEFWFKLLKEVINNLIYAIARNNFLGVVGAKKYGFDWRDVEIVRIDFAVNQPHNDRISAIKYLHYQSGLHKKHQRKDSGREITYEGQTLFFVGENYSVKIYHKGSEFDRIQSKKIIEMNRKRKAEAVEKGEEPLLLSSNIKYAAEKIQQLQQYSDRILRYEFTFRPGYMAYIFNRKINKGWSKQWLMFKKIFDYLEVRVENRKFLNNHRIMYCDIVGMPTTRDAAITQKYFVVERIEQVYEGSGVFKTIEREFTDKEYRYFKVLRTHGIVSRQDLSKWQKFMTAELNQVRSFRYAVDERDTTRQDVKNKDGQILYRNNAMTETPPVAKFTRTLMNFMLVELEKFFNNFQMDTKPTYTQFMEKIEKHNDTIMDKMLTAHLVDKIILEKQLLLPRTINALIEFNNLFSKLSVKTIRERYTKTTYHRLLKLHRMLNGTKFELAAAEFNNVEKDFLQIYKGLHDELTKGYLLQFYNTAFKGHYVG